MNHFLTVKNKLIAIAALVALGMLAMLGLQLYSNHTIHKLQETRLLVSKIESGMLMLRRHEKDFLARTNLKYHTKFNTSLDKTISRTNHLAEVLESLGLESTEAIQTQKALSSYGNKFNQLVKVVQTMGLDHKSGLYGSLRNAVHDVEEKVKSLDDNQLKADMLMLRRREKDFMLRWDLKYLEKFNKDLNTFAIHLNNSNHPSSAKEAIRKSMQNYQERFVSFVDGAQRKGLNSKLGILGDMRKTVHTTETLLGSMQTNLETLVEDKNTQLSALGWGIALTLLAMVIASVTLVALTIIRPISRLRQTMQEVEAHKDLTLRSDIRGYDEISQMSDTFNDMIDVFDRSVNEVYQSTVMLSTSSEELSMITQSTRDGVQRQQHETEQVATAMNEMTATVQEVARSANDAAAASRTADEQSHKGRELVSETISGIKSLATEVEKTSEEISDLKLETDNINTVLQVIGGIAEQTNLLALNAAIEAARAGEQGRGFAVVADEVRTLASRSHASTQEISEIIDRLQNRANKVVGAMEQSRELAHRCVDQADVAATSLDEITGAVSSINSMNMQIASAAEQQSSVSEEINKNIVNINDIAVGSTDAADQTLQTSRSLAELSTELQNVVNQFQLKNEIDAEAY